MPTGGLNLNVSDGTGAPLAYTDLGGGLFGMGIELVDPGATPIPAGAIDPFDATSGRNIVVITYDLQVATSAAVRATITNTASLFHFANSEGGGDFTTVDLTDDAQVRIAAPAVVKSITAITPGLAGNLTRVSIGERITYQVIVTIPEGTTPLARLVDTLDAGLAFVGIDSILRRRARSARALALSTTSVTQPFSRASVAERPTTAAGPRSTSERSQTLILMMQSLKQSR